MGQLQRSQDAGTFELLSTKLAPPRLRSALVPRDSLLARLGEAGLRALYDRAWLPDGRALSARRFAAARQALELLPEEDMFWRGLGLLGVKWRRGWPAR